jgi:aspartate/methionine/tyrosine aminotransferase
MLELANEIMRIESSGTKVIDLSLGQPDVPAPAHITKAFREAIGEPISSYSTSAGSPELRRLIAEEYTRTSKVKTDPSEVIVTSGSKHALFVSLLALLDPGDEILVPEPYFPPYAEICALTGARLKTVPVTWKAHKVELETSKLLTATSRRTKVILLNYPNNPAGWTLKRREVKEVVKFCSDEAISLVSDEIYDRIVFDNRLHCPAWTFSQGTNFVIGIGSFSKTYSMIPYRLGYVVAHNEVGREILKVVRATITMVNPYVQKAGCAALSGPQDFVTSRLAKYQERRDRCLQMLKKNGIAVPTPAGAFYLFIKLADTIDVQNFVRDLLNQDHVAVLPGAIFGRKWQKFVRLSLGTNDSSLFEGITRFVNRYLSNQWTSTD